jgi:hypothetical protein
MHAASIINVNKKKTCLFPSKEMIFISHVRKELKNQTNLSFVNLVAYDISFMNLLKISSLINELMFHRYRNLIFY